MKKIFCVLVLMVTIILISSANLYVSSFSVSDMTGDEPTGQTKTVIEDFGQGVIQIVTTVGSILSVIVLIILGIKYMMGSVEERATYKKTLLPYFIGATVLFGASVIAGIIYNIAINL